MPLPLSHPFSGLGIALILLHRCFTGHPSGLYWWNIFDMQIPSNCYILWHYLIRMLWFDMLGQLFFPVYFISLHFLFKWLYSQLNPYSCISYPIFFHISSNSSEKFHLQCSESLFIFSDVHVSVPYNTRWRANVLYKWTCVSNLALFLNVFAVTLSQFSRLWSRLSMFTSCLLYTSRCV